MVRKSSACVFHVDTWQQVLLLLMTRTTRALRRPPRQKNTSIGTCVILLPLLSLLVLVGVLLLPRVLADQSSVFCVSFSSSVLVAFAWKELSFVSSSSFSSIELSKGIYALQKEKARRRWCLFPDWLGGGRPKTKTKLVGWGESLIVFVCLCG